MNNLSDVYRRYLAALAAVEPEAQRSAFSLRYQVYCLERGYEDASQFPLRMETDHYDAHACHALVRARSDGCCPLGTSRLVLDTASPGALPMEIHGSSSVARHLAQVRDTPGAQIAEVSRLAVTRTLPPAPDLPHPARRVRSQHVTLGLVAMLFRMSWERGVTQWVALMETGLLRVLARIGLHFHPIGTIIEHRGARQPVMGRLSDLWAGVQAHGQPLARLARELGVPADAEWPAAEQSRTRGREIV